jgi:hypothetical protein
MVNSLNSGTRTAAAAQGTTIGFYLGTSLVLVMLVTKAHKSLLQEGIANQTGHNSEVFALAIAVAATIQFARPRWQVGPDGQQTNWGIVGAVAAGWLAAALGVYYLGFPPSIETLNEPFAAAALLTLYFGVPRPWRLSWLVPVVTVLITLATLQTAFVLNLSEMVTSLVAVAISVDLVQRTILRPGAHDAALLWLWWLFLLCWPAIMLAFRRQDPPGYLGDVVDYMARGAEGFWGAFLICVYFAVLYRLGGQGRRHAR